MKRYDYEYTIAGKGGYEVFDRKHSHSEPIAFTPSREFAEQICEALNNAR